MLLNGGREQREESRAAAKRGDLLAGAQRTASRMDGGGCWQHEEKKTEDTQMAGVGEQRRYL